MRRLGAGLRIACLLGPGLASLVATGHGQSPSPPAPESVRPIAPPARPLPTETESASVRRFSFLVYGDTRGRRDGVDLQYEHSLVVDAQLAAIRRLAETEFPVRFVLQTGDAVVNGRDPRQWNASFVALIDRLTGEGGVSYFLAPGNHDVTAAAALDDPGRQEGLRHYLQAVSRLIPPAAAARRLAGYPTYAFGYGNTFVIALDSNVAGDERQLEWVRGQLEGLDRARYVHRIVFFHHPPFSSGPHGGPRVERPTAELRARYLPLLRKHGVTVTFSGHDHLYEHWIERYDDPQGRRRRLDHVVTGGGGAPPYAFVGQPDLAEYLKANAAEKVALEPLARPGPARGDNPYHFVIVRVDGNEMGLEVVGVDWGRDFQPYRSRGTVLKDP
jgi:hypothetical protein